MQAKKSRVWSVKSRVWSVKKQGLESQAPGGCEESSRSWSRAHTAQGSLLSSAWGGFSSVWGSWRLSPGSVHSRLCPEPFPPAEHSSDALVALFLTEIPSFPHPGPHSRCPQTPNQSGTGARHREKGKGKEAEPRAGLWAGARCYPSVSQQTPECVGASARRG